MYTKECVFLLSTLGEEMFISKWLLPLEDHKDTVITQNSVRRRKVSLYIHQRSAEVEWKWDRALLYFAVRSPPGPDTTKPFTICFAGSLSLELTPMQEGIDQNNVPNHCPGDEELILYLIHVCYNATVCSTWDQISALHSAQTVLFCKCSQAWEGWLLEWVTAPRE